MNSIKRNRGKTKTAALLCALMMVLIPLSFGGAYGQEEGAGTSIALVEIYGTDEQNILESLEVDTIETYENAVLIDTDEETIDILTQNGLTVDTLPKRTTLYVGGHEFDFTEGEPDIQDELRVESYEPGVQGQYIVHMIGPIASNWRPQLEEMGVQIMNYVPNYAYRVRMTPEVASEISELYFVDWIGVYHPEYKLQPGLETGVVEIGIVSNENMNKVEQILKTVPIRSFTELANGIYLIIAEISIEDPLYKLAMIEDVYYISEYMEPEFHSEIDSQLIGGGAWFFDDDNNPSTPYRVYGDYGAYINQIGYTGKGVTIAVADSGIGDGTIGNAGHPDFTGRVVGGYAWWDDTWADTYGHGTHVAGIATANTTGGTGLTYAGHGPYYLAQGLAFEALLYAAKLACPEGELSTPEDYYDIVNIPKQEIGADIHTNSWGGGGRGNYSRSDHAYDMAVRDADHDTSENQPMVITVSAGNRVSLTSNPYGTTTSPGNAKNVITVGATLSYMPDATDYGRDPVHHAADNPSEVWCWSARGWTDDNRVKPDVVAPGNGILSTLSPSVQPDPSEVYTEDNRYLWAQGTSMSNPAVSGAAAVILDWYNQTYGMIPSPAMVKALLINTANNLQNIPNRDEGWGMVDISKLELPNSDPIPFYVSDQEHIFTETTQIKEHHIQVDRDEAPLNISLVWTDKEAPEDADDNPTLINDLNLEVIAPDGETIYRGNAFPYHPDVGSLSSFTSPDTNAMSVFDRNDDGWDDTNNVENIYIHPDEVESGVYTVRVIAKNIADDAVGVGYNSQDYALVAYNAYPPTPLPPHVEITYPFWGQTLGSDTITVQWTSDNYDFNIDRFEIRLDVGDWIDKGTATSHTFTGLSHGPHTVTVQVYLNVGGSDEDYVYFYIDLEGDDPPHVPMYINSVETEEDTATVEWISHSSTRVDYYEIRLDGGEWMKVGTSTSYTFKNLEERRYAVTVRMWDNAGDSWQDTAVFTIRGDPP